MKNLTALNTMRRKPGDDRVNALLEVMEEEGFARRLAEEIGELRAEMYEQMGQLRVDTIKWMFAFRVSQTLVIIRVFRLLR